MARHISTTSVLSWLLLLSVSTCVRLGAAIEESCTTSYVVSGKASPSSVLDLETINNLLEEHNKARREVFPWAAEMAMLEWDQTLADHVQSYMDTCPHLASLVESNVTDRTNIGLFSFLGENLAAGSDDSYLPPLGGTTAVKDWSAEASDWTYSTIGTKGSCGGGVCGNYTQMVWSATSKIGCAYTRCDSLVHKNYWGCVYGEGGNTAKQYPYEQTTDAEDVADCQITGATPVPAKDTPAPAKDTPAPAKDTPAPTPVPARTVPPTPTPPTTPTPNGTTDRETSPAPPPTPPTPPTPAPPVVPVSAACQTYLLNGTSPSSVLDVETINNLLEEHNKARREVFPWAAEMAMLEWDQTLADHVQSYMDTCPHLASLVPSSSSSRSNISGFKYLGENLVYGSDDSYLPPLGGTTAAKDWTAEVSDWTYGTYASGNSCPPNRVCDHYTQIVWGSTTKVGCAYKRCESLFYKNYWGCVYGEGGNLGKLYPYEQASNASQVASCQVTGDETPAPETTTPETPAPKPVLTPVPYRTVPLISSAPPGVTPTTVQLTTVPTSTPAPGNPQRNQDSVSTSTIIDASSTSSLSAAAAGHDDVVPLDVGFFFSTSGVASDFTVTTTLISVVYLMVAILLVVVT